MFVCGLSKQRVGSKGEIVIDIGIDSCAAASVIPRGLLQLPVRRDGRGDTYYTATKEPISDEGLQIVEGHGDAPTLVGRFRVASVSRTLMSLSQMVEQGIKVVFDSTAGKDSSRPLSTPRNSDFPGSQFSGVANQNMRNTVDYFASSLNQLIVAVGLSKNRFVIDVCSMHDLVVLFITDRRLRVAPYRQAFTMLAQHTSELHVTHWRVPSSVTIVRPVGRRWNDAPSWKSDKLSDHIRNSDFTEKPTRFVDLCSHVLGCCLRQARPKQVSFKLDFTLAHSKQCVTHDLTRDQKASWFAKTTASGKEGLGQMRCS